MKPLCISIFIIFSFFNSKSQNLTTTPLIGATIHLKYKNNAGTSFIVSINGSKYLITAKHIFKENNINIKNGSPIKFEIESASGWIAKYGKVLTHSNDFVDIAVIDLSENDKSKNTFQIGQDFIVGQTIFFTGFPFNLSMAYGSGFLNPLLKRGMVSGIGIDENNVKTIYIDAINNMGFSGGPVFTFENNSLNIIGVVSGYFSNKQKLFENELNSGIMVAIDINYVYEIINQK